MPTHKLLACPLSPAATVVVAADPKRNPLDPAVGTILAASPAAARILAGRLVYGSLPHASHIGRSSNSGAAHGQQTLLDLCDRQPAPSPVGRLLCDLVTSLPMHSSHATRPRGNAHNRSRHAARPMQRNPHKPNTKISPCGTARVLRLTDAPHACIVACRHRTAALSFSASIAIASSPLANANQEQQTVYDVWFIEELSGITSAHSTYMSSALQSIPAWWTAFLPSARVPDTTFPHTTYIRDLAMNPAVKYGRRSSILGLQENVLPVNIADEAADARLLTHAGSTSSASVRRQPTAHVSPFTPTNIRPPSKTAHLSHTVLSMRLSAFGRILQAFPLLEFAGTRVSECLGRFIMSVVDNRDLPTLVRALDDAWKHGSSRAIVRWTFSSTELDDDASASISSSSSCSNLEEIGFDSNKEKIPPKSQPAPQSTHNDDLHARSLPSADLSASPARSIVSASTTIANATKPVTIKCIDTHVITPPPYNYVLTPVDRDDRASIRVYTPTSDTDSGVISSTSSSSSASSVDPNAFGGIASSGPSMSSLSLSDHDDRDPIQPDTLNNAFKTNPDTDGVEDVQEQETTPTTRWILIEMVLCPALPSLSVSQSFLPSSPHISTKQDYIHSIDTEKTAVPTPQPVEQVHDVVDEPTLICFAREIVLYENDAENQHALVSPSTSSSSLYGSYTQTVTLDRYHDYHMLMNAGISNSSLSSTATTLSTLAPSNMTSAGHMSRSTSISTMSQHRQNYLPPIPQTVWDVLVSDDDDLPQTPSELVVDLVRTWILSPVANRIHRWTGFDARRIMGMQLIAMPRQPSGSEVDPQPDDHVAQNNETDRQQSTNGNTQQLDRRTRSYSSQTQSTRRSRHPTDPDDEMAVNDQPDHARTRLAHKHKHRHRRHCDPTPPSTPIGSDTDDKAFQHMRTRSTGFRTLRMGGAFTRSAYASIIFGVPPQKPSMPPRHTSPQNDM